MSEWTDESLIKSLRSNNDLEVNAAFKFLFREYFPSIKNYILSHRGTVKDAEDIFQDGLIVLYKKVRNEDFELTSALKTYVYSICKYIWYNRVRKKKEVELEEGTDFILPDEDQLTILIKSEAGELIADLFGELGEECKKLLVLFYYDRQKMKAIAQQLNLVSEQVAKNRKSRCLKKLREMVMQSTHYQDLFRSA
ncbi:MAG: sigma-70 family RNA polymerase sigma factor [Bacteroidota bacterium]